MLFVFLELSTTLQENNSVLTNISNDDRNNDKTTGCHYIHQEHSAKELMRVMLRIEERLRNLSHQQNESLNNGLEEETFEYAATDSHQLEALFNEIKDDEAKRKIFVEKGRKEVSKNKKKSIERILLLLAPPSTWKDYSKIGQRGKRSAMAIGVHTFLYSCLKKVSPIHTFSWIMRVNKRFILFSFCWLFQFCHNFMRDTIAFVEC